MKKRLLAAAGIILLFLFTGGCRNNQPPEGLNRPGDLTESQQARVVELVVQSPGAREWLQGRTDYRVSSVDWYAIVWSDGEAVQWWSLEYDRIAKEGVPDFVSPSASWYPGVTVAVGEGTITQMQAAVDLATGQVVMSTGPYPSLSSPDRFPAPE